MQLDVGEALVCPVGRRRRRQLGPVGVGMGTAMRCSVALQGLSLGCRGAQDEMQAINLPSPPISAPKYTIGRLKVKWHTSLPAEQSGTHRETTSGRPGGGVETLGEPPA